jgi:thiamine-phosphate pyrophosphorylase
MKLHAIVSELETAERAVDGGATVVQLRLKGASTDELVAAGRPILELCRRAGVPFVVNDDVDAALTLGADGVHLGRADRGWERARASDLLLGLSATNVEEAVEAEAHGPDYIGVGPVWATPTKPDAGRPLGLDGLAAVCAAVSTPVVAIGGIDATNAAQCLAVGAAGVAVVRAAADARALRRLLNAAPHAAR